MERDAEYAYNHVVQPELLLYVAAASGVDSQLVAAANRSFEKRTSLMQAAGAIRAIIPWGTVAAALWPSGKTESGGGGCEFFECRPFGSILKTHWHRDDAVKFGKPSYIRPYIGHQRKKSATD